MESRPAFPDAHSPEPPRPTSAQEFEEWAVAVQREAEKVTGGAVLECLHLEGTARKVQDRVQKPTGKDSFWTRDPDDRRPQMPAMPTMPITMGRMNFVSPEASTSPEPVLPSATIPKATHCTQPEFESPLHQGP